jgi:hypothetical protein
VVALGCAGGDQGVGTLGGGGGDGPLKFSDLVAAAAEAGQVAALDQQVVGLQSDGSRQAGCRFDRRRPGAQ